MADICVSSHHSSIAALLADSEFSGLANRLGFLVELRLDAYSDLNAQLLQTALKKFAPNMVATFRHSAEGGKNASVADLERIRYLQQAVDAGAKYIDIEARTPLTGFKKDTSKLVLSYHDFERVPERDELRRQYDSMAGRADADVIKMACFPKSMLDGARLLEILETSRADGRAAVILGMGEFGLWTRVAGPLFGSPFTFARGEGTNGTAPGQPTWRELDSLYRFTEIRPGWPVYGVIGNPIGHSLSPLLHNTAFRELKLDGLYLPFKVDCTPAEFLNAFRALQIKGLSVTIPHKETIGAACGQIDPLATSVGAINTLALRPQGKWFGTNTDAPAAAGALERAAGTLKGKTVLILGAGGAARAVAFGVKALGAEVLIGNRTYARAVSLAESAGGKPIEIGRASLSGIDCVVNTTPLGMHPNIDTTPLEKEQIPQGSIVFDTVYNPLRTKLLKLAAERGCRTLEGWVMFVDQGIRQFELWTGKTPPREILEKTVLSELKKRQ
jgi:3-dehydroquinate dehydratase/shikimate dehydrogenase